MLWPLVVLAIGAVCAGFLGFNYFVGEDHAEFWRAVRFCVLPGHDAMAGMERRAVLGRQAAAGGWAIRHLHGVGRIYLRSRDCPAWTARTFRPIYLLFLNKWYFDEIYDFLFVRAA